ncbi:S-adenosyl-L-methionine-dependent methyltransferase [Dentipellis sp. KUC8613]|nr:S-adenosyl-L-methionine-dependent methyltransferase [Dentipellis sp. KUC8613]
MTAVLRDSELYSSANSTVGIDVSGKDAYRKANQGGELDRLDEQHELFNRYLGNRITYAPLENPKKILEVGAGSGAWAIQAAIQYPDAEVIAADMAPLPERPLPPNVKFQQLNIFDPFPFEKGTFDAVHMRFVLMHVPQPNEIVKRLTELVRHGGWLIIEDMDQPPKVIPNAPSLTEAFTIMKKFMDSRGVCPTVGASLSQWFIDAGAFNEVSVRHLSIPMSPDSPDSTYSQLGRGMRLSMKRFFGEDSKDGKLTAIGVTPELQRRFSDEIERPGWKYDLQFYLVWSQKRA